MTFIDSSIIALSILALFIVIDGLVGTSLDCWKASTQTTSQEPQEPQAKEEAKQRIQKALEHVYIVIEQPATPVTLPETPLQEPKQKTLAQEVKERCSKYFGYEIKTPADIRQAVINRTDVGFMGNVNLQRKGNDFYNAVSALMDSLENSK